MSADATSQPGAIPLEMTLMPHLVWIEDSHQSTDISSPATASAQVHTTPAAQQTAAPLGKPESTHVVGRFGARQRRPATRSVTCQPPAAHRPAAPAAREGRVLLLEEAVRPPNSAAAATACQKRRRHEEVAISGRQAPAKTICWDLYYLLLGAGRTTQSPGEKGGLSQRDARLNRAGDPGRL